MAVKLVVVLAYIVVMLAIGWWSMRRTKNVGDFFIGGRTIGPWVSALAYGTTYFSAVLFVGFAGKIGWGFGTYSLLIALGNAFIGTLLTWALLATKTREITERLDAITMPEFLAARYGMPWMKSVAAVVIFVFLVPYSASVYQGLSHLFEVNLGIDYLQAVIFMAALTGVYLVMGGYLAVTMTDFVQGLLQVFGVIVMILLFSEATGLGLLGNLMSGTEPAHAPGLLGPPKPGQMFPGWLALMSLIFMTSVGPMGLPQMVQKFYSIRSREVIFRGMIIATVFSLLIACGAYYCGSLSHHFFAGKDALPQLAGGKGPDFDKIVPQMLTEHAPGWFATVVLLVVLAASMSTLASLVLVSSAAVVVDLVGARDRRDKSSKEGLGLLRMLCGVFIGLSVVLAAYKIGAIVTLMSMSWGALAGAFIGPYLFGILWKRTSPAGAAAGMLGGLGTAIALFFLLGKDNAPMAASIAMVVSLVLTPLVSLATPPTSDEILAKLEPESAGAPAQSEKTPEEATA